MTRNRFSDVITGIQLRAIQSIDETDSIFVNDSCIEEADVKESGFCFTGSVHRSGLYEYAINAWCQDIHLWSLLPAGCDELFCILEVTMIHGRFAEQATWIEWIAICGCDDADLS